MLAIVDSGGANIASVRFALERLGVASELTADPTVIRSAERVILPGVGSAAEGMKRLQAKGLVDCVRSLTQPVLGVCLGMQLLFEKSGEGDTPTLGIIPGEVALLPDSPGITVPHMGWNTLTTGREVDLLDGLIDQVHGADDKEVLGQPQRHGLPNVAALRRRQRAQSRRRHRCMDNDG